MDKNIAIILAAGKGSRMGAGKNKQFINLKNKPILYYTLSKFEACSCVDEVVLVAAKEEIEHCRINVVEKYGFRKVKHIIEGGKERQDSVLNGLKAIKECDIVLIHDGARPFVNNRIIEQGIDYAKTYGASACGVMPVDTIKIVGANGFSENTLDRNRLIAIQTPQTFKYEVIKSSHEKIKEEGIFVTDDTMVVEKFGNNVYLYEGDYTNIKITNKQDLLIAEEILKNLFTNHKDNV